MTKKTHQQRQQQLKLADQWRGDIPSKREGLANLSPILGVTIECRIVVSNPIDWDYVKETLDNCRCYGAAEVVKTEVFSE